MRLTNVYSFQDTKSKSRRPLTQTEYTEILHRIFGDDKSEFDINNLNFCSECHQQIDRLKVIEEEANRIRQNLSKIYFQTKNENLKISETGNREKSNS